MTLLWVDKIIQWRGHPLEDLTKTKCVFAELADFFSLVMVKVLGTHYQI